ncbi:hypothetical protein E2542_SST03739 [Spatholobus suberectus]|nr:hypothetical protein E2542_SST03739 [Spatholobus suberectus]
MFMGFVNVGLFSNGHDHFKVVIRWGPPPKYWLKWNVDASVTLGGHFVSWAGVLRDSNGTWKLGYTKKVAVKLVMQGCPEAHQYSSSYPALVAERVSIPHA